MRLDKFLANMGIGTRTEVKQYLKKGQVTVNDQLQKSPKLQINPEEDVICVNGEQVTYTDYVYLMLNKPQDVISATEDTQHRTVIELIPEYQHLSLFLVGRLDRDTEGLLLITNDGQFNHDIMSPGKHVAKTYAVTSKRPITDEDIQRFSEGIELSDGEAQPAQLEKSDTDLKSFVTLYEGRYHQVKRMFHAIDNEVTALKRVRIGQLELDPDLEPGAYRHLTDQDLDLIFKN
ncbi:16S rRNA pseudouridine516 synthase [Staphylococcus auricularis]